ncbi:MAG: anthranilate phosphoribosyltransferase [Candidatus Omnitrophota bacterium]|nr:anthranilate phosphoribosyltransferase [Candidatus Omnitrophota bacterium]MBU1894353.1 anthranilate phosphoribosyltransferase [Candidatus Omnitrophota bacterium]
MDIQSAIKKTVALDNLTEKEVYSVFDGIMAGQSTSAQIGAFITALRMKGETVDEITGAAKVMRKKALKIKIGLKADPIVDTCGTGGSGTNVFNISTVSAFVVAACNVKVAKHGNRSASGNCGSADVLEELGVKVDVSLKVVKKCIESINIGFLYAPLFHTAMKYAALPRREIGIRTIFNVLGPLSNPALATCQVLGVYDKDLTETLAKVLKKLGTKRAYVVHGMDSVDEVTITAKTKVSELCGGKIRSYFVSPSDFGLKKAKMKDIRGGSVKTNARIIRDVLKGKPGAKRDVVLMNSSMALMASGKVKSFKEGTKKSAQAIDTGAALEKLNALIAITNKKG